MQISVKFSNLVKEALSWLRPYFPNSPGYATAVQQLLVVAAMPSRLGEFLS